MLSKEVHAVLTRSYNNFSCKKSSKVLVMISRWLATEFLTKKTSHPTRLALNKAIKAAAELFAISNEHDCRANPCCTFIMPFEDVGWEREKAKEEKKLRRNAKVR